MLAWVLGAHAAYILRLQLENKEENFICVKIDGKLQYNDFKKIFNNKFLSKKCLVGKVFVQKNLVGLTQVV